MSLTLVLTRHASIISVLPVSGRPAIRGAPSSKSLVSSDGDVCVRDLFLCEHGSDCWFEKHVL